MWIINEDGDFINLNRIDAIIKTEDSIIAETANRSYDLIDGGSEELLNKLMIELEELLMPQVDLEILKMRCALDICSEEGLLTKTVRIVKSEDEINQ